MKWDNKFAWCPYLVNAQLTVTTSIIIIFTSDTTLRIVIMVMINDINGWEKCSKFSLWENSDSGNQKRHTWDTFFASNTGPRKWDVEKLEF